MKKTIGIGLIILAIALGYMGITKVSNSGGSVEIVGIELSASNDSKKTEGFIFIGLALAAFVGGIKLAGKN